MLDNAGNRVISLDVGQQVVVACVGSGNSLTFTGQQVNEAICTSNSRLLLTAGGQELPYQELGCIKKNKVLTEIGTCANGPGTAIRAGWQVGADLIGIYDMCHDKVKLLNYFSTNIIHGKSAAADDKSNTGPSVIKLNLTNKLIIY